MKSIFVAAIMAVGLTQCHTAEAQSFILHGVSHHTIDNGRYNNHNWGVGYRDVSGFTAGIFQNSEDRTTIYGGYSYGVNEYVSVTVGGAIGYRRSPVMPFLAGTLSIPIYERLRFTTSVLPMVSSFSNQFGVVIHTGLEYRYD